MMNRNKDTVPKIEIVASAKRRVKNFLDFFEANKFCDSSLKVLVELSSFASDPTMAQAVFDEGVLPVFMEVAQNIKNYASW